jgi:hypothetical protein
MLDDVGTMEGASSVAEIGVRALGADPNIKYSPLDRRAEREFFIVVRRPEVEAPFHFNYLERRAD